VVDGLESNEKTNDGYKKIMIPGGVGEQAKTSRAEGGVK
jgi:hypothetical protein